jgi:hypothetical protein
MDSRRKMQDGHPGEWPEPERSLRLRVAYAVIGSLTLVALTVWAVLWAHRVIG